MSLSVRRRARRSTRVLLSLLLIAGGISLGTTAATADVTTISNNTMRTAWDQNEAALSPASVSSSDFGQLFSTPVDGQVYAQPLVVGNTVVAATENNNVYGIDKVTGAKKWTRNLGPAWPASAIGCGDLVPNIGVTSTPVYDPSSGAIYLTAKTNDGPDVQHPHWYMHSLDINTGAERAGFPVTIQGTPTNNAGNPFDPFSAAQRPGLLLMNGVVYAGFASHCDYGSFTGSVVGVKTSGSISTIWSTVANNPNAWTGIWQGGSGLMSDGAGRIIVATGNGLGNNVTPNPGPGTGPETRFSESVVRLQVGTDGNLTVKDFFSPANNRDLDRNDVDLGSGGPLAIPDGYGTAAHPHLLMQIGKDGRLFLLDRDNLGGVAQGPGGTDAVVSQSGPYQGVWGHGAFWGGDGGYLYLVHNGGYLRAFKITVDASGTPVLVAAGNSPDTWAYTSGSPVVTSSGSTSGSALVWAIYSTGPSGANAQLRAYDALPENGVMKLRYSAPIGTATKFSVPATDAGRVYVGTRDGTVLGFGRPATTALTGSPVNFGSTAVGSTASATLTLTATKNVTVTGVATALPFGATFSGTKALTAGQTLAVPVTFSPTTTGGSSGTVTVSTNVGDVLFDLSGVGTKAGLASAPAALAFGSIAVGSGRTLSVNIQNTGTTSATVTASVAPAAPFSVVLPADGTVIPAGGSVAASVVYRPTAVGDQASSFTVYGSTGAVTVKLTGTAVVGTANLTLTPADLDYGAVLLGTSVTQTFRVGNGGKIKLTISKAAPPTAPFQVPTPIPEGTSLEGGQSVIQKVVLQPTVTGFSSGLYTFGSDDGNGAKSVAVHGTAGVVNNFVSADSGRCMDDKASATADGTPITIYDCNGTGAQSWTFGANASINVLGKCLDVAGGATANGSLAQLYTCNGTAAQRWAVSAAGVISNPASGRCLGTVSGGVTNGVPLAIQDCNGGKSQTWLSPQRTGTIVGPVSGRCLDVANSSTADGTAVQLYDCNQTTAQTWSIARGGTIQALGKCLDVKYAGKAVGTLVWLYSCNGTAAQQWVLQASGALLNPNSGRCLAPLAGNGNGTGMQIADCTADATRRWSLT